MVLRLINISLLLQFVASNALKTDRTINFIFECYHLHHIYSTNSQQGAEPGPYPLFNETITLAEAVSTDSGCSSVQTERLRFQ